LTPVADEQALAVATSRVVNACAGSCKRQRYMGPRDSYAPCPHASSSRPVSWER